MPAPCKRLVTDVKVPGLSHVAQSREIVDDPAHIAHRFGRNSRADENEICSKLPHQIELSLGFLESVQLSPSFKIAKGLQNGDFQTVIANQHRRLAGRSPKRSQIGFEKLDGAETCLAYGRNLFTKIPRNRNRSNTGLHHAPLS